ncbi:hypothetical protein L1987_42652 [Smallanthus sonchifolius]|uniref:Uncharacterized protein n=1 Tax=Smallanthus sonchifolius TaxID=185202 RepID=A0ACB9GK74_9ASTR|nr:hypothetical protein L1987_42652 [Smallanthus sonchifolius]
MKSSWSVPASSKKKDLMLGLMGGFHRGNSRISDNVSSVNKSEKETTIEIEAPCAFTFAPRYMNSFTKTTSLVSQVTVSLSSKLPSMVEYKIAEIGQKLVHFDGTMGFIADDLLSGPTEIRKKYLNVDSKSQLLI